MTIEDLISKLIESIDANTAAIREQGGTPAKPATATKPTKPAAKAPVEPEPEATADGDDGSEEREDPEVETKRNKLIALLKQVIAAADDAKTGKAAARALLAKFDAEAPEDIDADMLDAAIAVAKKKLA